MMITNITLRVASFDQLVETEGHRFVLKQAVVSKHAYVN